MIDYILNIIHEKFGLKVDSSKTANVLFLRINGIDNYSLARWMIEEFDSIKVTVKDKEGYKFSNFGWIKVEESTNKELVLT